MRILATFLVYLLCTSAFAATSCPQALPTTHPGFCPSFKAVAGCHCVSEGLPAKMCENLKLMYARMIATFGSLQATCEFQHYTDTQTCVNDWNCWMRGGKDSQGGLCSATGRACE